MAKRNNKTTYQLRNQRAKAAGFKSYAEQRKYRKEVAPLLGPGFKGTKEQAQKVVKGPSKPGDADYWAMLAQLIKDQEGDAWKQFRKDYKRQG